jgi:F420-dependent oxidoreductase-like protein
MVRRVVRLGLSMGTLGMGRFEPASQLELARAAERLGYHSLWASEGYGADPVALLAWLSAHTSTIGLGSGVLQISARGPVTAAMHAATIDQASAGRFRLGLGTSGPQVVEGWHGRRYDRPLARLRDYVAVTRMALAGEPVSYAGETLSLPLPDSRGKELALTISPHRERLPVYLAAMGPKAIALAGEIADGWLPIHFPPEHVAACREHLAEGARRAGRSLDGFDVAPMVTALIDEDDDYARDLMRPILAVYLGGMGTREVNFYNRLAARLGFADAAAATQEAYLAGRPGDAIDALPDELIDAMTLCGTPDRARERLAAYREAGAGTLIVTLAAPDLEDRLEQLELLAQLAG